MLIQNFEFFFFRIIYYQQINSFDICSWSGKFCIETKYHIVSFILSGGNEDWFWGRVSKKNLTLFMSKAQIYSEYINKYMVYLS